MEALLQIGVQSIIHNICNLILLLSYSNWFRRSSSSKALASAMLNTTLVFQLINFLRQEIPRPRGLDWASGLVGLWAPRQQGLVLEVVPPPPYRRRCASPLQECLHRPPLLPKPRIPVIRCSLSQGPPLDQSLRCIRLFWDALYLHGARCAAQLPGAPLRALSNVIAALAAKFNRGTGMLDLQGPCYASEV